MDRAATEDEEEKWSAGFARKIKKHGGLGRGFGAHELCSCDSLVSFLVTVLIHCSGNTHS
jgi:hypothetical protein